MASIISSRTPEGTPNQCPVCRTTLQIEPSPGTFDAPCPACGALLWFLRTREELLVYEANIAAPVFERVMQILGDSLGINREDFDPNTFIDDLDADSLDIVELVMELEDGFGVTISESDAEHFKTIADVIRSIIERLRGREHR
jgi:acyl carrier protein